MPRGMGRGWGHCQGGWGQPRRIRRFLEPALLLLLHHGPAHGYALTEGMSALGLETYPMEMSAVYRVLYDLEAQGMVTSHQDSAHTAGPPRRVYALTPEGDRYLAAWVEELRLTDALLHRFLEAYDRHLVQHQEQRGEPE